MAGPYTSSFFLISVFPELMATTRGTCREWSVFCEFCSWVNKTSEGEEQTRALGDAHVKVQHCAELEGSLGHA